jgi:hypothetical protein
MNDAGQIAWRYSGNLQWNGVGDQAAVAAIPLRAVS